MSMSICLCERATVQFITWVCYTCITSFYGRPMEYGRPLYFCPVVSSFYILLLLFFPRLISVSCRRLDVCHNSTHSVWLSANLRCRSKTCCTGLAENTRSKKSPKIAIWAPSHKLSDYILAIKARVDNRKKQQYILHMSP